MIELTDVIPEAEFLDLGKHNMVYELNDYVVKMNAFEQAEANLIQYLKQVMPEEFQRIDSFILNIGDEQIPIVVMPKYKTLPSFSCNDESLEKLCEIMETVSCSHERYDVLVEKCQEFYDENVDNDDITMEDAKNIMQQLRDLRQHGIYLHDLKPINLGEDNGVMTILDYGDYHHNQDIKLDDIHLNTITVEELKDLLNASHGPTRAMFT